MFVDIAEVQVKAGNGGNGLVSFRRERYIDRGGPDGGDGGDGGSVVIVGDRNVNTLQEFRHSPKVTADDGTPGGKANRRGKNGSDKIIKVPVGTIISNNEHGIIGDITEHEQHLIVALGGSGGFGNAHFKSSRRQAPKVAEKGEPGEKFELKLELKLIADVGLVGLPNAGKSTLLSSMSQARPKIANYPFTTLEPYLGVVESDKGSMLMADIPGLIEGASDGKGLGHEFLRHVERTAVLVHMVDAYSEDVAADYKTVQKELSSYKVDLSKRPLIVVLSKIDGLDDDIIEDQRKKLVKVSGSKNVLTVSSVKKLGLRELANKAFELVEQFRKQQEDEAEDSGVPVYKLDTEQAWNVAKQSDNSFRITGKKIEKFAVRTDFENEWGVTRLKDIMHKMGIMHELSRQGAEPGNTIYFGRSDQLKFEL